jgi:hypothetical protein
LDGVAPTLSRRTFGFARLDTPPIACADAGTSVRGNICNSFIQKLIVFEKVPYKFVPHIWFNKIGLSVSSDL